MSNLTLMNTDTAQPIRNLSHRKRLQSIYRPARRRISPLGELLRLDSRFGQIDLVRAHI